jgi:hypothetical protein
MSDPIFIMKFDHGLADRHRLPLAHVLSVLNEVRQMNVSVGKDVQRRRGIPEPSGDFGLELLAGRDGVVFKKGSVQAQVALTRDVNNGVFAADSVLSIVQKLGRMRVRWQYAGGGRQLNHRHCDTRTVRSRQRSGYDIEQCEPRSGGGTRFCYGAHRRHLGQFHSHNSAVTAQQQVIITASDGPDM